MKTFIRVLYVLLSVTVLALLAFSCVSLNRDEEAETPPADSSVETAVDSSEEAVSVPDSSKEESSEEESSEETSEETSEEETSEETSEELSEDVSRPVGGDTNPITPEPDEFTTSPYDAYFNNSIFVGHSVMVHFKNAVESWESNLDDKGILGDALFCCTSSFSCYNNLNQTPDDDDCTLPRYRGEYYNIEDLPAVTGRSRVFLGLMGLNDLGMVGSPETCAEEVTKEVIECINLIKQKSPETDIVILSATYLTRDKSYPRLNNKNMSLLNKYVLDYCNENGIDFIDVGSILCDGGGYLASVYSKDAYCHLTKDAYIHWMTVLRDYASKKMTSSWQNPTDIAIFGE